MCLFIKRARKHVHIQLSDRTAFALDIFLFRRVNAFLHEPPERGRSGDSVGLKATVAPYNSHREAVPIIFRFLGIRNYCTKCA